MPQRPLTNFQYKKMKNRRRKQRLIGFNALKVSDLRFPLESEVFYKEWSLQMKAMQIELKEIRDAELT
jgi:hypothetical protein